MTQHEATQVAKTLLDTHGERSFEISMPDKTGYDPMRSALDILGRATGPDGEFFVIKVSPAVDGTDVSPTPASNAGETV